MLNDRGSLQKAKASRRRQPCRLHTVGFTLVELLAVVVVILLLTGLIIGVAGYVQKQMAIAATKNQIAAISVALEMYKADNGYYPSTCPCRISATMFCESTNNWILYRALSGGGGRKKYMTFPVSRLRVNPASASNSLTGAVSAGGGLTNVVDVWGSPYNYFCLPGTPFVLTNTWVAYPPVGLVVNCGYTQGGQVNVGSFDLFSYGSDRFTYVTGAVYFAWPIYPWYHPSWTNKASAVDDITNFGR